jgi:hypothetical protein
MIGWIVGEIVILKQTPPGPTWTEMCYCAVGVVMVVPGLLVGRA